MAENILHPTAQDFDTLIKENEVVLTDFWADWCGPCKMLGPVIESLAQQYEGKAVFAKVNVDQENDLASRFGIMSIPTVIIFQNGKEVAREVGFKPAASYKGIIDSLL